MHARFGFNSSINFNMFKGVFIHDGIEIILLVIRSSARDSKYTQCFIRGKSNINKSLTAKFRKRNIPFDDRDLSILVT